MQEIPSFATLFFVLHIFFFAFFFSFFFSLFVTFFVVILIGAFYLKERKQVLGFENKLFYKKIVQRIFLNLIYKPFPII